MMIRSDEQVALEDLHRALRRTAAGHRDAAGTLDAGDRVRVSRLTDLADERERQADEIAALIRATGDLPDAPDADRETLRTAARHLKAAVSRDALLRDRQHAEEGLARVVADARASLGPEHQPLLDRIAARGFSDS
jgi:hypothetical protein